jgi:hypothetical protein
MTGFRAALKTKNRAIKARLRGARPALLDGMRASSQLLVDECGQLGLAHGTHFGGSELTAFEDHECGDAANTEFGGDIAVVVYVHFGDLQFALVGRGHFVEDGGNHFAGAAPFGPKINDHGLAGLKHVGFKCGVGNVFDQIAGHGLFLMNNVVAAKVASILTETRRSRSL